MPDTIGGQRILGRKLAYGLRVLPSYAWQRLRRPARGPAHLIFALADHFEPSVIPPDGGARAPLDEQERRLEDWCRNYPKLVEAWRDGEGRPFVHTYFYPAEQYDRGLIERLAAHCRAGWGEIEIHLHHGTEAPDTADNTRQQLLRFRDALAEQGCLARWNGSGLPRYAFVHGNFALANSAEGSDCGVDSEMQVLAETGCYADLTLPTSSFHAAQTAKINSLYECAAPLDRRAPHRQGRDLRRGSAPAVFPLILQGPLAIDFGRRSRSGLPGIENGAFTDSNPPSIRRLELWRRAAITVRGRPDWIFIKLHCHGMDPNHREAVLGAAMRDFVRHLVEGARERAEHLHFVSAREMVNIILAACDGREGNPGDYRDYRLKRVRATPAAEAPAASFCSSVSLQPANRIFSRLQLPGLIRAPLPG